MEDRLFDFFVYIFFVYIGIEHIEDTKEKERRQQEEKEKQEGKEKGTEEVKGGLLLYHNYYIIHITRIQQSEMKLR